MKTLIKILQILFDNTILICLALTLCWQTSIDMGQRRQIKDLNTKVENLIHTVSYNERNELYDEYIEGQYWKKRLWKYVENGDGKYSKIVDEAREYYFSEGWYERDRQQYNQKYNDRNY